MGELWRWNEHRTRSGSRAPEHGLVWQLGHLQHPEALQADTVPRRPCPEDSAQEHTVPRSKLLLGDSSVSSAKKATNLSNRSPNRSSNRDRVSCNIPPSATLPPPPAHSVD